MMVSANNAATPQTPGLTRAGSSTGAGAPEGRAKNKMTAGTSQFTTDGTNRAKKSPNASLPSCQTINVVMSPNGLKAPPALAATTVETAVMVTKRGLSRPKARTTAPITSAVVRLSSTADRKKAKIPVSQNSRR